MPTLVDDMRAILWVMSLNAQVGAPASPYGCEQHGRALAGADPEHRTLRILMEMGSTASIAGRPPLAVDRRICIACNVLEIWDGNSLAGLRAVYPVTSSSVYIPAA
jgi:hypothetical protein